MGVLPEGNAAASPFAHTLTSSIGGKQTAPVVTRFDVTWGNVLLLCSDGITKHLSDQRIRDRLRSMKSARQVCEDLLQDALDDGGTDNITVVVGRALPRDG
jgi:serine/threonine protein phosphatase PrpC